MDGWMNEFMTNMMYGWVFISLFPDGNYPYNSKIIKLPNGISHHRLALSPPLQLSFAFYLLVIVVVVVAGGQQSPAFSSSLLSFQLVLPLPFPVVVAVVVVAVPKFCSESIQLILAPAQLDVVVAADFYVAFGRQ